MDIEKLITLFPQYISEYLHAMFLTLRRPSLRFYPSELPKSKGAKRKATDKKSNELESIALNPKLISFVVLSIFIGSLLQSATPNHPPIKELPALVVIVMTVWLFISSVIFLIFRVLGGKGGYIDTISIGLQLMATLYVVASLVSLIATFMFFAGDADYLNSFFVYLTTQVVLLSIYLPLALKGLHFSESSKVNIGFVVAITLSILFFITVGSSFFFGGRVNNASMQIIGTLPP